LRCPWIQEYDYTLIGFPKKVYSKYIDDTIPPQEWEGLELFRPNASYYALQCGINSNKRTQKKDIFTLYDDVNTKVKLFIVHVLRTGEKVIQDERMFLEEKAWLIAQQRRGQQAMLLTTTIGTDPQIDSVARSVVESALGSALQIPSLDEKKRYARDISDSIYESCETWYTIRDLFFVASDILVFIDKVHFGRYAHVFTKKVSRMMYIPKALLGLEYDEKFPEAFSNINISTSNIKYIYDLIVQSRSEITGSLGAQLARLIDPTLRIRGIDLVRPPVVDLPQAQSSCQVSGYEDWELLTYSYSGRTYCYPISLLIDKFLSKDYSNKDTGVDFDTTFVTHVLNTYQPIAVSIPLVESDIIKTPPSKSTGRDVIDALLSKLEELEKQIINIDPIKNAKVCAYCSKYISKGGVSTLDKSGDVVKFCSMNCLST
jgi:hypothetical protein